MGGLRATEPFVLGQHGALLCDFELLGSQVYSVKWYKDGQEFYRIMPSMEDQFRVFSVPGVTIDQERSNLTTVEVSSIDRHTEGLYSCEVSGKAPSFHTSVSQARVRVVGEIFEHRTDNIIIFYLQLFLLGPSYLECLPLIKLGTW